MENFSSGLLSSIPWAFLGDIEDPAVLAQQLKEERTYWNGKQPFLPKFSLITPTWNTEPRFVIELIESCLAQSYPHWELILIDDASSNLHHLSYIQTYKEQDSRIKFYSNPQNLGISGSRNRAISIATGDWIGILDHDDLLHPRVLSYFAKFMAEHPEISFLFCNEYKIDAKSRLLSDFFYKPKFDRKTLLRSNYIAHFTVVRTSLYQSLFRSEGVLFRPEYDGVEDHDCFLRLSKTPEFHAAHVPVFGYVWRKSATSTAEHVSAKPYVNDRLQKLVNRDLDPSQWTLQLPLDSQSKWPYLKAIGSNQWVILISICDHFSFEEIKSFINMLKDQRGSLTFMILTPALTQELWLKVIDEVQLNSKIQIVPSVPDEGWHAIWYAPRSLSLSREDSLLFVCQTFEQDPECGWVGFRLLGPNSEKLPSSFRFALKMQGGLQLCKERHQPFFADDDLLSPCVVGPSSFFSKAFWNHAAPLLNAELEEWELMRLLSLHRMTCYYAGSHELQLLDAPKSLLWVKSLTEFPSQTEEINQSGSISPAYYRSSTGQGSFSSSDSVFIDKPFRYKVADLVNEALKSYLRPLHSLLKRQLSKQILRG